MGFLKFGVTDSCSSVRPSSVVLLPTAMAMSATFRMASSTKSRQ